MNILALMKRSIFILLILFTSSIYASVPKKDFKLEIIEKVTDENLKDLALKKGVIPKNVSKQEELDKKNTVTLWILQPRDEKINLINFLKKTYKDDGVFIKKPAELYVDEINTVIYNSLNGDFVFGRDKKGVGVIFKTIAIMDGDFDNGENKLKLLKEWFGPEQTKRIKKYFPGKIEKLNK
ncbi:MAG: hypothetical protein KAI43_02995 [Candidatus Aureabacteria bacterium]|nr:hypothetical protein [Candidatus Auribacterota bacterium]